MAFVNDQPSNFGVADYAVFAIMLCISSCIGIYYGCSGNRQKTAGEFLTANRSMGLIPVTLSLVATFLSSLTLLGVPAEIYTYGTVYAAVCLCYFIALPVCAYWYLPVFYDLGLTSVHEDWFQRFFLIIAILLTKSGLYFFQYLEKRFNSTVRKCISIIYALQTLMMMSMILYAPALALNQATGIPTWGSVAATGIVCIVYSTIGGIKAVMWTDVLQVCVIWVTMLVVVILGTRRLNGIENVWEESVKGGRMEIVNFDTSPFTRHTTWNIIFGAFGNFLFVYGVNQMQVQRYLSSPSLHKAQISLLMNIPATIFHQVLCILTGLLIYAQYSSCDPLASKRIDSLNQLLPLYVMDIVGGIPGLPGLFVAGIYSASLSTLSSGLNSLAAITLEDFVKTSCLKNRGAERDGFISKMLAFIFGIITMALVVVTAQIGGLIEDMHSKLTREKQHNVLQNAYITLFGTIGSPMASVFTLGLFFPWANSTGALAGLATGFGLVLWIAIGAQVTKPYVPKLGISVDGCNFTDVVYNITLVDEKEVLPIYKLSYQWYSMVALGTVVIIGLIVSFLTGYQDPRQVDAKLLSPAIRKLVTRLPMKHRNVLQCNFKEQEAESKPPNNAANHELDVTKL